MTEPTHDDYAAKRLRSILKLLDLSVPLDDEEMMGDGLFTTLGMVRGALERRQAHEPNAKLMELADRIDHQELWRRPGLERLTMPQEQRDQLDAGVALRRYADLLGNDGWRLYPPRPGLCFRAGSLATVVDMARKDEARRTDSND